MFENLSGAGIVAAALTAPPDAEFLAALATIDPTAINPSAQVDLLIVVERHIAWVTSLLQPALLAVADTETNDGYDQPCEPEGSGRAEVGAALRINPHAASVRLLIAEHLCGRLSAVHAALAEGIISYAHAVAFVDSTGPLTDDQTVRVIDRVLPKAGGQSVAELRRALRRAVLKIDPSLAMHRAAQAHAERKLDWWPLADGMAEMRVTAAAADIMAIVHRVDTVARHDFGTRRDGLRVHIETRRSDALVHLILTTTDNGSGTDNESGTATGGRPKADVGLIIDLATVLGQADNPGELAGYGPIDPAAARELASTGSWRRLVCDPISGALLDLGRTAYQPTDGLGRYIRARDTRCEFPHCNQPAHRSEIDHTIPYRPGEPTGGPTDRNNLGVLCKHHHQLKHRRGWTLTRNPDTEEATWTSPTGHRYHIAHEDHRAFNDLNDDHCQPTSQTDNPTANTAADDSLQTLTPPTEGERYTTENSKDTDYPAAA